jgi:hypothetical protein
VGLFDHLINRYLLITIMLLKPEIKFNSKYTNAPAKLRGAAIPTVNTDQCNFAGHSSQLSPTVPEVKSIVTDFILLHYVIAL